MLMFFGFTHCERVCPRQLTKLSTVLDELGPLAEHLQALYISVDPARDTPAVMRGFLAARFPRFLGLTGTAAQIDALRARFRVYAAPATDGLAPDGYVVAHTAFAYLVQRGGRCIAHFSDALEAGTITTSLRNHLAQRAAVTGLAL